MRSPCHNWLAYYDGEVPPVLAASVLAGVLSLSMPGPHLISFLGSPHVLQMAQGTSRRQ